METAMRFTYIQFDGKWQKGFGNMMIYKPADKGQKVLVVAEGETGIKTTYTFQVDSDVYVSYTHNVVLLPSQCVQMVRGDKTSCIKK